MNYPSLPNDSSRRPPRRSNFFFLFILGFMALFLFSQYKKASARANAYRKQADASVPKNDEDGIQDFTIPDISNDGADAQSVPRGPSGLPIGTDRPKNSDWELDTDVLEAKKPTQLVIGSDKGADKVSSGDWAIEVSESQASTKNPLGDVAKKPVAKTTEEGDWELSEVETTATPAP